MNLTQAIKSIQLLKMLYDKFPSTHVKHRIEIPFRHVKLADEFFHRNINAGDLVTVSGYLSKYCQFFSPVSYSSMVYTPAIEKRTPKVEIRPDGFYRYDEVQAQLGGMEPSVYPMQLLPQINPDYRVAFLYPEELSSFYCSKNLNGTAKDQHHLHPIPILLTNEKYTRHAESYIKLTGKVQGLNDDLRDYYCRETLSEHSQALMYLHFRPHSEQIGFVLDCREDNVITKIEKNSQGIIGGIYIEGHFEGAPEDMFAYDFGNLMKKTIASTNGVVNNTFNCRVYGVNPDLGVQKDNLQKQENRHYLRSDDIKIIQQDKFFSFYTPVNINDERSRLSSEQQIQSAYTECRKNITNYLKKSGFRNSSFQLDFIWDYRKAHMFHKKGFLSSTEAQKAFQEDQSLQGTKDWLSS